MSIVFLQDELDKIHAIQLEMLIEFDRICRKYGIKYIISGGTLLGAIRNKGFIPWDDDIDIRMDRNEYIRFTEICLNELDTKRYFFQDHNTDPEYPWYYGKLRYNFSRYTRAGQEHLKMKDGIFVDIMPADGLPNNAILRNITIFECFILKKFLYSAVGCVSEKNILKKMGYKLMNFIPKRWIFNKLDKISTRYNKNKYNYVTSYSFVRCGQKQFTERIWHTDCVEVKFEGKLFFAPKEYEKWLSMTYGEDYMLPPPEEKRVGHNKISDFYIKEEK